MEGVIAGILLLGIFVWGLVTGFDDGTNFY